MYKYYYREFDRIKNSYLVDKIYREYYRVDFENGLSDFIYENTGTLERTDDTDSLIVRIRTHPKLYIEISQEDFNKVLVILELSQ